MIEDRIKRYWTRRAHDFSTVRKNELKNHLRMAWLQELSAHLPTSSPIRVLDIGTGSGFFSILLAKEGISVEGIDLTEAMLSEARALANEENVDIPFFAMDAQNLDYEKEIFDLVLSRNLTWTLTDAKQAYAEWFRVLKPGGILLNFDANYGTHERGHSLQNRQVSPDSPYGHLGITDALAKENTLITLFMDISKQDRPHWDKEVLLSTGFSSCDIDLDVGKRILGELDLDDAPMFGIYAIK